MKTHSHETLAALVTLILGAASATAAEPNGPWAVFLDDLSDSECGVINADNAELVMLDDTGELVVVTAADHVLAGSRVEDNGDVFIDDEPFGTITYATDGDGTRTVWWVTVTGKVIHLDDLTLEPSATDREAVDYVVVPCDACDFWDDPDVCTEVSSSPEPTLGLCGAGLTQGLFASLMTGMIGLRFARSRPRP